MAAVGDNEPVPHVCPGTPGPCTPSTPRMEPRTKQKTVYTLKFKKEVVEYAELKENNREAAIFYKIADEGMIRKWKKALAKVSANEIKKGNRKRVPGGGRKPDNVEMENVLLDWVMQQRDQGLRVTRKCITAEGLERLENLLKLDINQVDLENLCQMDPNSFQQVERIMEGQMGDGLDELLENELLVDEDYEDGGSALVIEEQELRQTLVESEEEVEDDAEDDDDDLDDDTEPLFKQSSLGSIRKMVANNNRKRFFGSVESSPSLKEASSPKRFRF